MGKKESPKKESFSLEKESKQKGFVVAGKLSFISDTAFAVIKLMLGFCLLPFVYSVTASFLRQFSRVDAVYRGYFWAGVVIFIAVYLFVGEPAILYESGHRVLEFVFSFFQPFVKVAPNLLPIYAIIIFVVYGIMSFFVKGAWLLHGALLLTGFFIMLHLVFSAKTVRTGKDDFLKGNYIFSFSFIYIANVLLVGIFVGLAVSGFSIGDFLGRAARAYADIFYAIFKQLFLY
jgi:hypothetical protein